MNRVLVTGADGFIGRVLCKVLAARGYHVIAATRSGNKVDSAHENRQVGDLGQPDGVGELVSDVNSIVHLAARVHIMLEDTLDPLSEFRRVNVEGTRRIAEAAEHQGINRLVFLSTIKVNGETTQGRAFTVLDVPHPQDAYGQSKWEAEQVLSEIGSRGKLETVILRVPLVYGPGVKANFLSLLRLCHSPLPLPFGALTKNRRSFLYVENVADVIVKALEHPNAPGHTFLVSDGEPISTAQLVRGLRAAFGRPARLVPVPEWILRLLLAVIGKTAATDRLTGSLEIDNTAAAQVLGWHPPVDIQNGIADTVAWYRGISKSG